MKKFFANNFISFQSLIYENKKNKKERNIYYGRKIN